MSGDGVGVGVGVGPGAGAGAGAGIGVGVGVGVGVAAQPANRGFTIYVSPSHPKTLLDSRVIRRRVYCHQKVGLDVEFSKRTLKGWTEITVVPTDPNLKIIRLNVRQCTLTHISINNKGPGSKYTDTYARLKLHELADVSHHQYLREKLDPALKEPLEEELVITLPKSVKIEVQNPSAAAAQNGALNSSAANVSAAASPGPGALTPGPAPPAANVVQYVPLKVRIEFVVDNIRDGFQFVGAEDDPRLPHAYTMNTVMPGSASCIFPCIDSLWERHTWEIEVTCPRTLGDIGKAIQPVPQQSAPTRQNNTGNFTADIYKTMQPFRTDKEFTYSYDGDDSELDFVVVCSGQAVDEKIDPKDPSKKICSFQVADPTTPQHIAFVVGPFEKANLTEFRESEEDDAMGVNAIEVHGYALPGRLEDVKNTCMFMQKAVDYFVRTFGMYPFAAKLFNLCFVDDLPSHTIPASSMAICSSRILFGEDQIDPIYPTTRQLTYALAAQWSGISVVPKSWQDIWIVIGIAQYITALFLRKLLGNNEYRFRLKKDTERLCAIDVDRPSLHDHGLLPPFGPSDFDFISLKAPLVLYILDQRLRKGTNSLGLGRVLPKIFLQAFSGTDPEASLLSTANFVRGCEKVGHTKLDKFFNQWVYSSGCPRFEISQRFNKKKMIVEMIIRQVRNADKRRHVSPEGFIDDAVAFRKGEYQDVPQKLFTGPMTIRIHEADGTPYEHVVELKDWATKLEIPYNTKYKRLKRTKRQKERMAATAGADVNADAQADDGVLLYCLGDVLQSEEDMQDWQLAEWTKEQEDKMSQEAFEWIRVDADFEWLCTMTINQPDHMFLSQLQQDRDVTAQYEAVKHFRMTTGSVMRSTILVRTVMDRRYYYGIRVEAARGLATCATPELNWIGRVHLEKAFQEFYCFPNSSVPLANDFSDFTSYFVQNGIVMAMSDIRDKDGSSPLFVQRFLLNLLRYNENSNNAFADHYYVSTIITALQACVRDKVPKPLDEDIGMNFDFDDDDDDDTDDALDNMVAEIERFQRMDQWLPSFQNVISITALEFKKNLILKKHRETDLLEFLAYAREGTLDVLRVKAIQCMIQLGGLKSPGLLGYISSVLSDDSSPYVRLETLKAFSTGLGAIATGDDTVSASVDASGEVIMEDEDPTRHPDRARESLEGALDLFRKILADNEIMQQCIWKAICAPTIGIIAMRKLLDICNLLYEPKKTLIVPLRYRKPRRLIAVKYDNCKMRFIWNPTKDQVATLLPNLIRPPPAFLTRVPTPQLPPPPPPVPAPPEPFEPQPPKRQLKLKPPKDPNAPPAPAPTPPVSVPTPPAAPPPPPAAPKEPKPKKEKLPKIKLKANKATPTPPPEVVATPAPPPKLRIKLNIGAIKAANASQAPPVANGSPESESN